MSETMREWILVAVVLSPFIVIVIALIVSAIRNRGAVIVQADEYRGKLVKPYDSTVEHTLTSEAGVRNLTRGISRMTF